MRRAPLVLALVVLMSGTASAAPPVSAWRFAADAGTRVSQGGPPAAWTLQDGTTLLGVCSPMNPPRLYESRDGLAFTAVQGEAICDTPVRLRDGRYRAYTSQGGGRPGRDKIISAISDDGRSFRPDPGVRISKGGFGVPMAVMLPSGEIRLYWVGPQDSVVSARSKDGLGFTKEPGTRFPAHYVDHAVIRRPNGTWLAIAVTPSYPGNQGPRQRVFVGTSKDGLAWSFEAKPILAPAGKHAFDPDIIALGNDRYRVYYGLGSRGFEGPAKILSGVLSPR